MKTRVNGRTGAEQLRDWMARRGFNQRAAVAYLQWDETYFSKIVNGKRKPGRSNSVYLEEKTGIPVSAW
jgi:hypothetical protein